MVTPVIASTRPGKERHRSPLVHPTSYSGPSLTGNGSVSTGIDAMDLVLRSPDFSLRHHEALEVQPNAYFAIDTGSDEVISEG